MQTNIFFMINNPSLKAIVINVIKKSLELKMPQNESPYPYLNFNKGQSFNLNQSTIN